MTKLQPESTESHPTPLNAIEMISLVGAGMIAVGVFCPAIVYGSSQSFIEYGSTISAIVLGFSAAIAWLIFQRRGDSVTRLGMVNLAAIVVYGFYVWLDVLREPPQKTFFGPIAAEFQLMAWLAMATGSVVVVLAGMRAREDGERHTESDQTDSRLVGAGVSIATLGCLWGIAIANPFGPLAPNGVLREIRAEYREELQWLRWGILALSLFAVVTSHLHSRWAREILRQVIAISVIVIGFSLVTILALISADLSINLTALIACAVATYLFFVLSGDNGAVGRWKWLALVLPLSVSIPFFLMMGDLFLLGLLFGPLVIGVGTGYLICMISRWAVKASVMSLLLLGTPCCLLLFDEIPNEILRSCGINESEGHAIAFGVIYLLGRSLMLAQRSRETVTADIGQKTRCHQERSEELRPDEEARRATVQ